MRARQIEQRLVLLLRDELRCRVEIASAHAWRLLPVEPRYRFGYGPPVLTQPATVVVRFSPELLDEITCWLSDDDLDIYLMAVETFLAAHLVLRDLTSDEIMQRLENELLDDAPRALQLMSTVELRAIDDGLVARTEPNTN